MLQIESLPALNDNYIHIIINSSSNEAAVVDPALFEPVDSFLQKNNLKLTHILNTHHHFDHVGGNLELKTKYNCQILSSKYDQERIPGVDKTLIDGELIQICDQKFKVIATPGHTLGHIIYHCADENLLFCGDTLFLLGCGRLFEGTAEQMLNSLNIIRALPKDTNIYCTHEYTESNLEFSLSLLPNNEPLLNRQIKIKDTRAKNLPTVPGKLEDELQTNLFLLANYQELKKALNLPSASELEVFTELRKRKDNY